MIHNEDEIYSNKAQTGQTGQQGQQGQTGQTIKKLSWKYRMPENCDPIEIFLMNLKAKIEMIERLNHDSDNNHRHQFHVMLDARDVYRISAAVRMKMDSFCKTYLKRIENAICYATILVNNEEQQKKMDKLYGSSGIKDYEIILPSNVVERNLSDYFSI